MLLLFVSSRLLLWILCIFIYDFFWPGLAMLIHNFST